MTTADVLRRTLAQQLAAKCARHHLVVWDDAARHYDGVAEAVVPNGWQVERYSGSWWDLRRRVETVFAGATPPKLVVYVPSAPPAADPLEEIRRAAGSYNRRLSTLLKDALDGQLGAARIDDLGARSATLTAAEEALAGGSELDPVLVAALGANDADAVLATIALREATFDGGTDVAGAVATLSGRRLGLDVGPESDSNAHAAALARQLLLCVVAEILGGDVARKLVPGWASPERRQLGNARDLLERLTRSTSISKWAALADVAAAELGLDHLAWDDRLIECDVARCIDQLAFDVAARLVSDDPDTAHRIAATRVDRSRWLRWRDQWSARMLAELDAVRSLAKFNVAIRTHPVPAAASLDEIYRWYADGAWKVDRCQRLMETARFRTTAPELDKAYTTAREAYLTWLDDLLRVTNGAAPMGTDLTVRRQAEVYAHYVARAERVALVIVDAMRLEIGHRLAEILDGVVTATTVDCAVAAVPTTTAVGMANLLPDALDRGLGVQLADDSVTVTIGDRAIRTVADRTAAYRAAAGRVEDHPLSEWLTLGDDVLTDRIANADLVVVRAQEIDAAGESGLIMRWSQIDATVDALAILISRLGGGGITTVVVTADHGFIALGRPLDPSRVRQPPTGPGVIDHGRAWIGRPATVPEGCTAIALSEFGINSEATVVLPDGMTVFGSAGAGFFHGGISPQEALVPVVVAELDVAVRRPSEVLNVTVEVPSGKISAQAFSVRVTMAGSLFAGTAPVRLSAVDNDGDSVARLVPSEEVDAQTGTVTLDPTRETTLTYLVTRNLDKGAAVAVTVLDATTGRELATARATVARPLRPEEEW